MENATLRLNYSVDPLIRFVVKRFHNPDGDDQHYFCFLKPNFHSLGTDSLSSTSTVDVDQNLMFPFLGKDKSFFVSCSTCLGLLYVEGCDSQIGICNLKTKEFKFLSEPTMKCSPSFTSPFGSGFGYDAKSCDYKVIRFYTHYNCEKIKGTKEEKLTSTENVAEVYSLLIDTWNKIPHPEATICFKTYAYVNDTGMYYWIGLFDSGFGILSFDFATETFSSYSLPPSDIHKCVYTLVGYNCLLFAISYERSPSQAGKALVPGGSKKFEIWELNCSIRSWKRIFHVVLCDVEKAVGLKYNMLFLEGRSRRSDNLCQLLVYDLTTGKLKGTGIFDYPGQMKIFDYVCPLNGSSTSTDVEDEDSAQSSLSTQLSLIRM